MTLESAKKLRDITWHLKPAVSRIDFRSVKAWEKYWAQHQIDARRLEHWVRQFNSDWTPKSRSPIEIMIDRACGLE